MPIDEGNGAREPGTGAIGDTVERLNSILWTERDLLDELLFAIETERWVRSTGRRRFDLLARERLRATGHLLRRTEVLRAAESDAVAARLGLAAARSLVELADGAGDPWRTILLDQRAALRAATHEVVQAGLSATTPSGG